jgi:hypothetical protein
MRFTPRLAFRGMLTCNRERWSDGVVQVGSAAALGLAMIVDTAVHVMAITTMLRLAMSCTSLVRS